MDIAPDGSSSATVTVPRVAVPGQASVSVVGSRYDEPCEDTASCALQGALFVVLPAP